jgi:nucleoside-diphosphate-sugar epimerase
MQQTPLAKVDLDHILTGSESCWEQMRGQRLFITGGTGFFGCWLLESFCHINKQLQLDANATVLTRRLDAFKQKSPHLFAEKCLTFVQGDVRDFTFPSGNFAFVIHAATEASAKQAAENPTEMLTTIIDGTERVLEFARSHHTRKFLLTSSGAVYGKQPNNLTHIPESYLGGPDPLDPASVYAEGKRISEQMCALAAKQSSIEFKIGRCFAFLGPHLPLDAHFAIGNFIGDVLAGRPILIAGDGTPRRSYLYAADLAVWLWTMLFRAPSLIPFNIGSAKDLSILEIAQAVARVLNPQTEIRVSQQPTPDAAVARYVPSVDRASEMLGLQQMIDLEESIRRTAQWYGFRLEAR